MPDRDGRMDWLKAISILCVIVIHVSSGGWSAYPAGSLQWVTNMFWASASRAAVPVFLMVSGALLLDPQKAMPLKKLYFRNLLRLCAAMFVWAAAYKLRHLIVENRFSAAAIWEECKQILVFNQEFHLYYIHITILVYLCLPVTRVFAANATKRQIEYALGLWFALGILYPTLLQFWPFSLLSGFSRQWMINMSFAAVGYGLLGYYIRFYACPERRKSLLLIAAGFFTVFFGTWYMCVSRGTFVDLFLGGMSPGVALLAAGIFGCCRPKKPAPPAVAWLSGASFCVYLVHVFFLYGFESLGFLIGFMPNLFSVPLVTAAIFLCSCAVYAILSRIPVVNRWLI